MLFPDAGPLLTFECQILPRALDSAERQMPNGLKIFNILDPYSSYMELTWIVNSGTAADPQAKHGLAHMLEHMQFRNLKQAGINHSDLVNLGIKLNAYTTFVSTVFQIRAPKPHVEVAFKVLAALIGSQTFTDVDLETERKVILAERASATLDPITYFLKDQGNYFLQGRSCEGRSILGSAQSIAEITQEDLRGFWRSQYTTDNSILLVIADDFRLADDLVRQHVGSLPKTVHAKQIDESESLFETKAPLIQELPVSGVSCCFGFPSFNPHSPNFAAAVVLGELIGGPLGTHLMNRLRDELGLTYSISTRLVFDQRASVQRIEIFTPDARNTAEVINAVKATLKYLKTVELTDAEFSAAKERASAPLGYTSSPEWITNCLVTGNEIVCPRKIAIDIRYLTKADILRVANLVFDFNKMRLVVVGETAEVRL